MPLVMWPTVSGLRTVAGGASREVDVFDAAWVTWPAVSGLRTVAGGGRLLRGSNFTTTGRRGLLRLAGGLT